MDEIRPFSEDISIGSENFAGLTSKQMPTEKEKRGIEKETGYLAGRKVPPVTKEDEARIRRTKGLVPHWWPETDTSDKVSYIYGAKKAIKGYNVSADEVEEAVKAATKGQLTQIQKNIIRLGWPYRRQGEEIIAGKRTMQPRKYGEFYHKDKGWY